MNEPATPPVTAAPLLPVPPAGPVRPVDPAAPVVPATPVASGPEIDERAVDTGVFAWEWARRLAGTGWVAADRTEIAERLRQLTGTLLDALRAEPFDPVAGIAVGEQLVGYGFDSPDALSRTTALLGHRLVRDLMLPDTDLLAERVAELNGTVAHGFVRAVRDRTLAQQEAIRSSAMLAWHRARADQLESARHDPLTGLLNRPGLAGRLADLNRRHPGAVLGLCLLSLDDFETLDHGLGREAADRVLLEVARRLQSEFAGPDDVVGRVARSEFLVAGVDRTGVPLAAGPVTSTAAERQATAQAVIARPIPVSGRSVVLSTSCGLLTRGAGPGVAAERLLQDVDLAVSWARGRGPGAVALYESSRAERHVRDLGLAADLPAAIADGTLRPHFQPIVSLRDGRIEAVEALARWHHPEHGLLRPDRFLPLAERAGLSTTLDQAVLRAACRQARRWERTTARPPVVTVNLAAVPLTDRRTVRDVLDVLEATGLDPALLQLEITEHAALAAPETLRIIGDLARQGIGLALDDFGTGRAHLAQLADLPGHGVRTLKLPADFLHGPHLCANGGRRPQGSDQARIQVFAAIIDLAHDLGLRVTAEGVETAENDLQVRALGADLAQGLFYAPASPGEDVSALLGC
jgi:diguanylate cyclase